jgi:glycolate oxidase
MIPLVSDLRALLAPERVLDEPEDLLTYGFDGTAALQGEAGVVVFPQTTEEVAKIVRYAAREKIPIVSRGSGTGLSGGSIPTSDAIVLCLVKMDRVLELDEKNLTVFAEAGAITLQIAEAADAVGSCIRPIRAR